MKLNDYPDTDLPGSDKVQDWNRFAVTESIRLYPRLIGFQYLALILSIPVFAAILLPSAAPLKLQSSSLQVIVCIGEAAIIGLIRRQKATLRRELAELKTMLPERLCQRDRTFCRVAAVTLACTALLILAQIFMPGLRHCGRSF